MKGLISVLWFPYQIFCFYSLLVYALILWIPFDGWLAGFMMMSFPVVMLIHLISIPVWFVLGKKKALIPLVMACLGFIFLPRTYAVGKADNEMPPRAFKVLSYNTHMFLLNAHPRTPQVREEIEEMKAWVANSQADVICMPEFYSDFSKDLNVFAALRKKGYKYHKIFETIEDKDPKNYSGLAVFSKHPIISAKDTVFVAQNGAIRADIKMGNDTVRIIGLHLYSMTLTLSGLAHQRKFDGVVREGKFNLRKMKSGFIHRSGEVDFLETWVKDSPYPVILCGDFNEVPYGYAYGKFRRDFKNAFEEKGSGFGFTFNYLPYFIRIDHQFYDGDRLDLHSFRTRRDVKFSDHYPIEGIYSFRKK